MAKTLRFPRICGSAALMSILMVNGFAAQACSGTFSHPELTNHQHNSLLVKALMFIGNNRVHGTAFLIDRESGLYITAAHVVENLVDDTSTTITGVNSTLFDKPVELKVLKSYFEDRDTLDFALLKLKDRKLPNNVRALELAFGLPDTGNDKVRFSGFGAASDTYPNLRPVSEVPATILRRGGRDREVYYFATDIDEGDSGGPVLLPNGNVIGFITHHQSKTQAIFHSIAKYAKKIVIDARQHIKPKLLSVIDDAPESIGAMLDTSGDGSLSNLGFVISVVEMKKNDKLKDINYDLIDCPLYPASAARNLGYFAASIQERVWEKEIAGIGLSALLRRADELVSSKDYVQSVALYRFVAERHQRDLAELLTTPTAQRAIAGALTRAQHFSVVNRVDNRPGSLRPLTGLRIRVLTAGESREVYSPLLTIARRLNLPVSTFFSIAEPKTDAGYKSYTSEKLSVMLHDYATVMSKLGRVERLLPDQDSASEINLVIAARAAALGAAVAGDHSPFRSANIDSRAYILNSIDRGNLAVQVIHNAHFIDPILSNVESPELRPGWEKDREGAQNVVRLLTARKSSTPDDLVSQSIFDGIIR